MTLVSRRRVIVDDSALAASIGDRLRAARRRAGLTQQQVADGRYTKAYVSALEKGHAKPSMAALNFLAERLGMPPSHFLGADTARWSRMEADLLLTAGKWDAACEAYQALLKNATDRGNRAELLRGFAEALCRLDRGGDAIAPAAESVEIFDQLNRERDSVQAGYWLAYGIFQKENVDEARSILRSIVDRVRGGLDVTADFMVRLLVALATIESRDGRHEVAISYLEEARAQSADLDDRRRAAYLSAVAVSAQEHGDLETAIRLGSESLALYDAADAQLESAMIENNLAGAYLSAGNIGRATELAAEAHARYATLGDRRQLAHVLETEAQIALARDDVPAAMAHADEAIAMATETENTKALTSALLTKARGEVRRKRLDTAHELYAQATDLVRRAGPRPRLQRVLGEWADVLAALGRHEEAFGLTREALNGAVPTTR